MPLALRHHLPPGPAWPAPLQTLRMLRDPYGFVVGCHRRFGDWFTLRIIPCGTMVHVADPSAVRDLFADTALLAGAVNGYMRPLLGEGLLTLDGERHAEHRRWIAPALAAEPVRQHAAMIASEAAAEIATWPVGRPFSLAASFERLALRVVRRVLLGEGGAELEPVVVRLKRRGLIDAMTAEVGRRLHLGGESARLVAAIDRVVAGEIAARREGRTSGRDLLASLMAVRRADGSGLDDRELRDEVVTLLFTGHETVATTLAWLFERVLRHPDVHARLAAAPDDDAYLDAAIKETMRLRSCIPDVGRRLVAPLAAGSYRLPAGSQVFAAIVPLHMRADLYPDPESFRPERYLDGLRTHEPWAFLPFGGGMRRCVGAALAMLEMRVIARTVLAGATLRADRAEPERGTSNGVTIRPHRGARAVMAGRPAG